MGSSKSLKINAISFGKISEIGSSKLIFANA